MFVVQDQRVQILSTSLTSDWGEQAATSGSFSSYWGRLFARIHSPITSRRDPLLPERLAWRPFSIWQRSSAIDPRRFEKTRRQQCWRWDEPIVLHYSECRTSFQCFLALFRSLYALCFFSRSFEAKLFGQRNLNTEEKSTPTISCFFLR